MYTPAGGALGDRLYGLCGGSKNHIILLNTEAPIGLKWAKNENCSAENIQVKTLAAT